MLRNFEHLRRNNVITSAILLLSFHFYGLPIFLSPEAKAQKILRKEPSRGKLRCGQRVLVRDGTCGQGRVKEVIGGCRSKNQNRRRRCIPTRARTVSRKCVIKDSQKLTAKSGCTAYRQYWLGPAGKEASARVILTFLHGDVSRGNVDYIYRIAETYKDRYSRVGLKDVLIVAPLRMGYEDSVGNRSSGVKYRRDMYRKPVIRHTTDFLTALKKSYPEAKNVVVGHSGGAAIAGVIAGQAPGLVDVFVFVGIPSNVPLWREKYRNRRKWPRSLSPHDFVRKTSPEAEFHIISGKADRSTPLLLSEMYYRSLKDLNRNVMLHRLDKLRHNQFLRSQKTLQIVYKAIKE